MASRLGLRSFSRRDSVSDCTQFSLGDVFKSLKIRESPPGFKTARRKRFIRRSPRVLGGKEGEPGEVGGGAEGWEALRFLRSPPAGTRTCFAVGRPSPWGLGSSYLLPAPAGSWAAAGRFARRCCAAGKQARARREEETLGLGLPGVRALPHTFHFSEVPLHPTTGPALPSPAARAQATTEGWCPGSCAGIYRDDVLCTRSCWACKLGHRWSFLSYSTSWLLLNLYPWRPKEFYRLLQWGAQSNHFLGQKPMGLCPYQSYHGRDWDFACMPKAHCGTSHHP